MATIHLAGSVACFVIGPILAIIGGFGLGILRGLNPMWFELLIFLGCGIIIAGVGIARAAKN